MDRRYDYIIYIRKRKYFAYKNKIINFLKKLEKVWKKRLTLSFLIWYYVKAVDCESVFDGATTEVVEEEKIYNCIAKWKVLFERIRRVRKAKDIHISKEKLIWLISKTLKAILRLYAATKISRVRIIEFFLVKTSR